MSDHSAIEWTEATWNPVRGCTKVSAGCKHCYAEAFAERFRGVKGHPYEQGFDVRLVPEALDLPLRWKKPRRIFVNSMSDLFHEDVPDDFITRVWSTMVVAERHTFQVLTKRPARMAAFVSDWLAHMRAGTRKPVENIWLGTSVEDQVAADERIPHLLATPAAVRFVSAEPLLGPVDLRALHGHVSFGDHVDLCVDALVGRFAAAWAGRNTRFDAQSGQLAAIGIGKIDWLIVGGESGPKARPMNLAWASSLVHQCRAAGTACFVKQLGRRPYEHAEILGGEGYDGKDLADVMNRPRLRVQRDGWTRVTSAGEAHLARYWRLCDRKGGDPSEWPADLRVREMPREAIR